jgi:hypothetical protein
MALPSGVPISLSEVKTEFGGPGTLSAYVRNGAYVDDWPHNAGVPTAVPIQLQDLLGAAAAAITIDNAGTVQDVNTAPNQARAGIQWGTGGELIYWRDNASNTDASPNWGDPLFASWGNDYDCRLDWVGGSSDLHTLSLNSGQWYSITVARFFYVRRNTTVGVTTGDFNMRIRPTGGVADISYGTVTLTAELV